MTATRYVRMTTNTVIKSSDFSKSSVTPPLGPLGPRGPYRTVCLYIFYKTVELSQDCTYGL